MKKTLTALACALTLATSSFAAGVEWKNENGTISASVTNSDAEARLAVYKDGALVSVSNDLSVDASDFDEAKVFLWNKSNLEPTSPLLSILTPDGVQIPFGSEIWVSDNQVSNKASSVANRSFDALSGNYRVSFYLTVDKTGDNAVLLGDSDNGTLGYGLSSATLLFTSGGKFSVRNGNGSGSYTASAVELCDATEGETYFVEIEGAVSDNSYTIYITDSSGTEYESKLLSARTNATKIDTVALVSNSKNTVKANERYSDFNFHVNDFKAEALADNYFTLYDGFGGVYYGVKANGKYLRGNNGKISVDYASVKDNSAMFMPRYMGDGSYAFVCRSSSNRITATDEGEKLKSAAYAYNDDTQHWTLESAGEENAYYLKSLYNELYAGVKDGYLVSVGEDEKAVFTFNLLKDKSPLYQVSETEAYALLTSHQRERIEEIYASVAADAFPRYGAWGEYTPRTRFDKVFTAVLDGTLDTDAQKEKLLTLLDPDENYIYNNSATESAVGTDLPGVAGQTYEIGEGTYSERKDGSGGYLFWTNTYLSGTKYPLYIYNADGTLQQTLTLYVHDKWYAKSNTTPTCEALSQIPAVYRKYLKNVRIREDSANSLNCGKTDLYVRMGWTMSTTQLRNDILHELTHSLDAANNWLSSGSEWSSAMSSDCFRATVYAGTSNAEDFAEFGRLYFMCYKNRDMQRGLQIIMPERYAIYKRVRNNSLGGFSLWED